MRPSGGNPLDLNNLPEDFGGKHAFEESTTTTAASMDNNGGIRKKKKEGKDEKIYECRFCSLKFCKSQALGGHMNRHRQERENETLNRARQLVFSNDNITGVGAHIGLNDLSFGNNMQAMPSSLNFGHVYPRIPNPSSHSTHNLHSNTYYQSPFPSSSSSPAAVPRLPAPPPPHHMSDHYYHGRLPGSTSHHNTSNYSCFGSEGVISRTPNVNGREGGNTCISSTNMDCGNWNVGSNQRSFVHRTAEPSSFDRFRDGI